MQTHATSASTARDPRPTLRTIDVQLSHHIAQILTRGCTCAVEIGTGERGLSSSTVERVRVARVRSRGVWVVRDVVNGRGRKVR